MKFIEGEDGKHQVVCDGVCKEDETNDDKDASLYFFFLLDCLPVLRFHVQNPSKFSFAATV